MRLRTFIIVILLLLAALAQSATLTHKEANQRVEERVETFLSIVGSGAGAEETVHYFVATQIPDRDELIVGIVDGSVLQLTGSGPEVDYEQITALPTGSGVTGDLHWARVEADDGTRQSSVVVAVDTSAATALDLARWFSLAGAAAVLLLMTVLVPAPSRRRQAS